MNEKAIMKSKSLEIFGTSLIVGTLDLLAAVVYFHVDTGKDDFLLILKYIASGLFGKRVFTGSNGWSLAGLLLHYGIAFFFTVLFYSVLPRARVLRRNTVLSGIGYGVFIWIIMNLVVVPLSFIGSKPVDAAKAAINLLILIMCIGIPLSIRANRYYAEN
jgi:hypothetical protein